MFFVKLQTSLNQSKFRDRLTEKSGSTYYSQYIEIPSQIIHLIFYYFFKTKIQISWSSIIPRAGSLSGPTQAG